MTNDSLVVKISVTVKRIPSVVFSMLSPLTGCLVAWVIPNDLSYRWWHFVVLSLAGIGWLALMWFKHNRLPFPADAEDISVSQIK